MLSPHHCGGKKYIIVIQLATLQHCKPSALIQWHCKSEAILFEVQRHSKTNPFYAEEHPSVSSLTSDIGVQAGRLHESHGEVDEEAAVSAAPVRQGPGVRPELRVGGPQHDVPGAPSCSC